MRFLLGSKFEANLSEMRVAFLMPKGRHNVFEGEAAVDHWFDPRLINRPDHIQLLATAPDEDSLQAHLLDECGNKGDRAFDAGKDADQRDVAAYPNGRHRLFYG